MPKKSLQEQKHNTVNIQALNHQKDNEDEDEDFIDYFPKTERKNNIRGCSSTTVLPFTKRPTDLTTSSSFKKQHHQNTLSIIPFNYHDENESNPDNSYFRPFTSKSSNTDQFNTKISNDKSDSNTSKNETNNHKHIHIVNIPKNEEFVKNNQPKIEKDLAFLQSQHVYQNNQSAKENKTPINKLSRCILIKKNSSVSFENSIVKRFTKMNNLDKPQTVEESLLFSITPDDENTQKLLPHVHQNIILDNDILNNNKLIIENYIGNLIHENDCININAGGMINGKRNKRDGLTKFGFEQDKDNNEAINDYILNDTSNTINHNEIKTLFSIKFSPNHQRYYIHPSLKFSSNDISMKKKHLIYKRIEDYQYIIKRTFIQIGKILFIFNQTKDSNLFISAYTKGNKTPKEYHFDKSTNSTIIIGNKRNHEVSIEEEGLECRVKYDNNYNGWLFEYKKDYKANQNVYAWVLCDSKEEISSHITLLKIGKNIIKITVINP